MYFSPPPSTATKYRCFCVVGKHLGCYICVFGESVYMYSCCILFCLTEPWLQLKFNILLSHHSFYGVLQLHILEDIWGSRLVYIFDFSNLHALCLCLKITLNNIFKLLMCEKAKLYLMNWFLHTFKKIKFPFCSDTKQKSEGKQCFLEMILYFKMVKIWIPLMKMYGAHFKS